MIAVANGLLAREDVVRRYQLSEDKLLSSQQAFEAHGLRGLRSTQLQQYRSPDFRRGDRSGR